MAFSINVDNIKCGGCAHTISSKLAALEGVGGVEVSVEEGRVDVDADPGLRETIAQTLKSLGYPETGTVAGMDNVKAKAVSFVSCAIGRMEKD